MKCTLNPNILSISGKMGGVLYKTYKRPDGKTETRAYMLPRRDNGKYGYERQTPVTKGELAARQRFTEMSLRCKNMPKEQKLAYYHDWKEANYTLNGKKYGTLRGYIIARLYQEVDDPK